MWSIINYIDLINNSIITDLDISSAINVDTYFGYIKEINSVYGRCDSGQASHSYFDISSIKCLHRYVQHVLIFPMII